MTPGMRRVASHGWLRQSALSLAILCELLFANSAPAADDHKQVLVLYSNRRDAEFSVIGEAELPKILDVGLARNLDYYSEFIDIARFPDPTYRNAMTDFVRTKYQGIRFDAVIALGDVSVEFVTGSRDGLFRDTPVVFLTNDRATGRIANSTGITVARNFAGTLSLVDTLQPDVKNVFVVSGAAAADRRFERLARSQFAPFQSRFTFTWLAGLRTSELEERLSTLPAQSIVYYLLVTEDGAGDKFHPLEFIDRIAVAASVPTYSWASSTMGHGVVGGSLYVQKDAIDRAGALSLRVLRGASPDSIAPETLDLNVNQVDWRQLRRWGIDEARVPAGTLVLFREPTVWDRYKVPILGAVAILLVQSALIAGLLIQRGRRRRAEDRLRESQVELLTSYERIRALGARLLGAQESERSRIARELHDDISQQVSLLVIDLAMLRSGRYTEPQKLTDEALSRAESIIKSVRDLSHRLHPAKLRLIGLVAALRDLEHEMAQAEVRVTFNHDNVPTALPPELTLCLFRIAQEALQNALKYSCARQVSVNLSGGAEGLTLTVVDDGVGFDVDAAWGTGLGLVSMAERVEAVGGRFELGSKPGAGTTLTVHVPLSALQHVDTVAV